MLWFLTLVFAPFAHPNVRLAYLTAGEYQLLKVPPRAYTAEDYAGFVELSQRLTGERPLVLTNMRTPAEMGTLARDLEQIAVNPLSDVLVLYINAYATARDGTPQLVCRDFDPANPNAGVYGIGEVIRQVRSARAKTKIVLLDTSPLVTETSLPPAADDFPQLLRSTIEQETFDTDLWVLSAHGMFETSHVSPALRRSVFGFFAARGLRGAADANADRQVDLGELHRYVSANVAAWVGEATDAQATQTPVVIWGGGALPTSPAWPMLVPVTRSAETFAADDLRDVIDQAQAEARLSGYDPPDPDAETSTQPDMLQQRTAARLSTAAAMVDPAPIAPAATTPLLTTTPEGSNQPAASNGTNAEAQPATTTPANDKTPVAGTGEASPTPQGDTAATAAADGQPSGDQPTAGGGDGGSGAGNLLQQAKDAAKSVLGGDDAEAQRKLAQRTAQQLMAGWEFRDRWFLPQPDKTRPVDYAPHLWREFEAGLLGQELLFRAGSISKAEQIDSEVKKTLTALRIRLDEPPPPRPPAKHDLADRLWEARPQLDGVYTPRSAALANLLARYSAWTPPARWQENVGRLEYFAESGTRPEFLEWMNTLAPEYANFYEFQLAQQIATVHDAPFAVAQLALSTRCAAERLAAASLWGTPWIRDLVDQGDLYRIAGERALLDGIGSTRDQRAARHLRAAQSFYRDAADRLQVLEETRLQVHDLLHRLPTYLTWQRSGTPYGPPVAELKQLCQLLEETTALLETPSPENFATLRHLRDRLSALENRIETAWQMASVEDLTRLPAAAGDAWRMQGLLGVSLPASRPRQALLANLVKIDARTMRDFGIEPNPSLTPRPRLASADEAAQLATTAELLVCQARLSTVHSTEQDAPAYQTVARSADALRHIADSWAGGEASAEDDPWEAQYFRAADTFQKDWDEFQRQLPAEIAQLTQANANLREEDTRAVRKTSLRAAERCLRLVNARYARDVVLPLPSSPLQLGELFDLLVWQRERYQRQRDDAPTAEAAWLADAAGLYAQQALSVRDQPAVIVKGLPQLEVEGPTGLRLTQTPQGSVELRLTWAGPPQTPFCVAVDYDPELMEVSGPPGVPLYGEPAQWQEGATPAANGIGYPYRPDMHNLPPTLKLSPGAPADFKLTIKSNGVAPRDGRVIVKLIGGGLHQRFVLPVSLPVVERVALEVAGITGSWSPTDEGVSLHPFPNRNTTYRLSLRNRADAAATVQAELFALPQPKGLISRGITIPRGALPAEDANRLLEQLLPLVPLTALPELTLTAGQTLPLPFPLAPGGEEGGGDAAGPPPVLATLPHGLLLVVTNLQTGQKSLTRVAIEPQRPRRYVRPRVSYDLDKQRLNVVVRPENPELLPDGPITVRWDLNGTLPPDTEALLEDVIEAPKYEARLFAVVPSTDRVLPIALSVDDFPRAFLYQVRCDRHVAAVPEDMDRLAVRILSPQGGLAHEAPLGTLPVSLEVDAPVGSFNTDRDRLTVGFDVDLDREIADEGLVLRLDSDRQTRIDLMQMTPTGDITLAAEVGDFEIDVPVPQLQNAKVAVLARLDAAGRTAYSSSRDVLLDGALPQVDRIALGSGVAVLGEPLEVLIDAHDDLTRVASLEVGIDGERKGEFNNPPPVPAKRQESGRWLAKVPVDGIAPGIYNLLARATDDVGHVGPFTSVKVQVITAEQKAAMKAALTNLVRGRITYDGTPVEGVQVTLTAAPEQDPPPPVPEPVTTDEYGIFIFPKVSMGMFELSAEGVYRNKKRRANETITVPEPPVQLRPLALKLK